MQKKCRYVTKFVAKFNENIKMSIKLSYKKHNRHRFKVLKMIVYKLRKAVEIYIIYIFNKILIMILALNQLKICF